MPYLNDIHKIIKKVLCLLFLDNYEIRSRKFRRELETPTQSKILKARRSTGGGI